MAFQTPFHFYCEAGQWVELRELLRAALDDVPASAWRPGVLSPKVKNPLEERGHYRAELRKMHDPYSLDVSEACAERFWNGGWPVMKPAVVYWARTALCHAVLFVEGACFESGGERVTIFPFPDASVADVAVWFCTDWWLEIGYESYLARACSDVNIFASQFKG